MLVNNPVIVSTEVKDISLTVIKVPERHMALAGILNLGWTCSQIFDHGKHPSRDTAQSVREHVVATSGQ